MRATMEALHFPPGYGWNFGSEIVRSQQQQGEMGMNMLLALACVFFVMASLFESLLYPLVVMGTVPFASLGVFWLMMATGTPFNLMAEIGLLILMGIVVNSSGIGYAVASFDLSLYDTAGGLICVDTISVNQLRAGQERAFRGSIRCADYDPAAVVGWKLQFAGAH